MPLTVTVALLVGREPAQRYSLYHGYADSIWRVGATPVVLTPPPSSLAAIDRYVEAALSCDAICLTGGDDVDPRLYGEEPSEHVTQLDAGRDAAELAAVRAAVDAGIPVLGICRGIQLIAVALGGSLHQDLPTAGYPGHWEESRQAEPVHRVTAEAGSLALTALAGATSVNSIHHQAVRDPGPLLSATARAEDGVIEAVETTGVLGIQWHPERLAGVDERHLAPFRWLAGSRVPA
jgi:putative glutamine amidotransferase